MHILSTSSAFSAYVKPLPSNDGPAGAASANGSNAGLSNFTTTTTATAAIPSAPSPAPAATSLFVIPSSVEDLTNVGNLQASTSSITPDSAGDPAASAESTAATLLIHRPGGSHQADPTEPTASTLLMRPPQASASTGAPEPVDSQSTTPIAATLQIAPPVLTSSSTLASSDQPVAATLLMPPKGFGDRRELAGPTDEANGLPAPATLVVARPANGGSDTDASPLKQASKSTAFTGLLDNLDRNFSAQGALNTDALGDELESTRTQSAVQAFEYASTSAEQTDRAASSAQNLEVQAFNVKI